MDELDPLPDWALADCEAWHHIVASVSDDGLHLEVLESWRLDDGDSTRGHTMMCLRVYNVGVDVGTLILRGRSRAGLDLWLGFGATLPLPTNSSTGRERSIDRREPPILTWALDRWVRESSAPSPFIEEEVQKNSLSLDADSNGAKQGTEDGTVISK